MLSGTRGWEFALASGRAVECLGDRLLQEFAELRRQRCTSRVSHIKHVFGAFANGENFCCLNADAVIAQHLTHLAEQARTVAGNDLHHGAVICFVRFEADVRGGGKHPDLAGRAPRHPQGLFLAGGYGLFQVPTYRDRYRFSVNEYLASLSAPAMQHHIEMHIMPMERVFSTIHGAGCIPVQVFQDTWAGPGYESFSFLIHKPENPR